MDGDLVHDRVAAHEGDGLLEVRGLAVDPLAVIAVLGDGVLLRIQ